MAEISQFYDVICAINLFSVKIDKKKLQNGNTPLQTCHWSLEKIETKESDDSLKYLIDEGPSTAPRFEFHPVDPSTIEKEIKKLKCSKSAGYDKVSVKLVRDAAGILCRPLAAIFNSSFEMGIFPDMWKIARVTSISSLVRRTTWAITGLYPCYLFSRGC